MKLIAQMDEMLGINIETDSTFAILLEAQNRGHEIFYYLPSSLTYDFVQKKLSALVKKIRLKNSKQNHCEIISSEERDLREFDVILVRQDPPFDMNYITSTYLLERVKDQVLILNNPSEIRNSPEKIFIANFSDLTPPTLISNDIKKIAAFRDEHGSIVLKPLYACGGDGVILLQKNDPNLNSVFDMMVKAYQTPVIAQKFLPEVKNGDKRIILLNGRPIGAISRIAKTGEIRSNLHIGGDAKKATLSKKDQEICEHIGPELKKRGLFFVGIDVIGDYLTEINVTSPTCILEINQFDNVKLEKEVVDGIEELVRGV